ncbi:hypothetical protein [Maribacter sp. 2210JD10-5]|uniref:hypothetical protein n=1 Tax=Maribacter sp. 2210JD10-5 TaxID=3386272 RepID=UPI0039BD3851
MKLQPILLFLFLTFIFLSLNAQNTPKDSIETVDYIEFNDRNNVVHGVYLGLNTHYGQTFKEPSYGFGFNIAYVANQQFEIGLAVNVFQSDQQFITSELIDNKLTGGYIGLHLEPIFFSKNRISLSIPIVIGLGAVGYFTQGDGDFDDDFLDAEFDDVNVMRVFEPGVSALFNISRYLQLEAGVKYRFTNRFDFATSPVKNLNGYSVGLGIKVGVFNMGRNRYKKKVPN